MRVETEKYYIAKQWISIVNGILNLSVAKVFIVTIYTLCICTISIFYMYISQKFASSVYGLRTMSKGAVCWLIL